MNTKTTITLSITVLAAVALLFVSTAVTQAHALWVGGWGWHHPWLGWHGGWGWHHPWLGWHHPWGWHGEGWDNDGW